jgi:membrane dipeptidase
MVDTAGADHVGIGSDFVAELFAEKVPPCDRPLILEGTNTEVLVPGLTGPADLPRVTAAMLAAGVPDRSIRGVLGRNLARVLGAAGQDPS